MHRCIFIVIITMYMAYIYNTHNSDRVFFICFSLHVVNSTILSVHIYTQQQLVIFYCTYEEAE